ncbi:hypothetical protein F4677DRAFT_291783 [Hypoxylon crocopeplum]|nr:hypothetical protein F4677DRAFT_291783 [Hypoxylon crocopeplum]
MPERISHSNTMENNQHQQEPRTKNPVSILTNALLRLLSTLVAHNMATVLAEGFTRAVNIFEIVLYLALVACDLVGRIVDRVGHGFAVLGGVVDWISVSAPIVLSDKDLKSLRDPFTFW